MRGKLDLVERFKYCSPTKARPLRVASCCASSLTAFCDAYGAVTLLDEAGEVSQVIQTGVADAEWMALHRGLLCVATLGQAQLWSLSPSDQKQGLQLLLPLPKPPSALAVDASGALLAVASADLITVIKTKRGSTFATYQLLSCDAATGAATTGAAAGTVTSVVFLSHLLVGGDDEGWLSVWDLRERQPVARQRECKSGADITCLIAWEELHDEGVGRIAAASSSGEVWVFRVHNAELTELAAFNLRRASVEKAWGAHDPGYGDLDGSHGQDGGYGGNGSDAKVEVGYGVLTGGFLGPENVVLVTPSAVVGVCMVSRAITVLASIAAEETGMVVLASVSQRDTSRACMNGEDEDDAGVAIAEAAVVYSTMFGEGLRALRCTCGQSPEPTSRIPLFSLPQAMGKLPEHSPLLKRFSLPNLGAAKGKYKPQDRGKRSQLGRSRSNADLPVTFHSKIKSSGYGITPPVMAMFSGSKPRSKKGKAGKDLLGKGGGARRRPLSDLGAYPVNCGLLDQHQPANELSSYLGKAESLPAITSIAIARDAKVLAVAGMDQVLRTYKLPISRHRGQGCCFRGHDKYIHSVNFSHSGRCLATASADGTARVWHSSVTEESVLTISPKGKGDIGRAMFFYLDGFLLVSKGPTLHMLTYKLQPTSGRASPEQLQRDRQGQFKKAHSWQCDAQSITWFDSHTSTLSPLIVAAASDRSVVLFDAAVGTVSCTIPDAHTKPAHTVCLPSSACLASGDTSGASYDVFLSAAADNSVRMWDMRDRRSIASFTSHPNRRGKCGIAFSPCMRWVACGAEDKTTHLYDLRAGRKLTSVSGHRDSVSDVAFNPIYPQLVTASLDGSVRFYSDE